MGYHETYEFLAIDRPLRDSEIRALRRLSSRVAISRTRPARTRRGPRHQPRPGAIAALVHAAGYLLATGAVAVLVYERVGLGFLRRGWINLDLIWAVPLVATGLATLAL